MEHYTREELNERDLSFLRWLLRQHGIESKQGENAKKPEAIKAAKRWLVRTILAEQDKSPPSGFRGLVTRCHVCDEPPGKSYHKCCACGHRADGHKAILSDFGFRPVSGGMKTPQGVCRPCRQKSAKLSAMPKEKRLQQTLDENEMLRARIRELEASP